jgi:hypothetical protein
MAQIIDCDIGAGCGERNCGSPADAAASAGDQRYFAV